MKQYLNRLPEYLNKYLKTNLNKIDDIVEGVVHYLIISIHARHSRLIVVQKRSVWKGKVPGRCISGSAAAERMVTLECYFRHL